MAACQLHGVTGPRWDNTYLLMLPLENTKRNGTTYQDRCMFVALHIATCTTVEKHMYASGGGNTLPSPRCILSRLTVTRQCLCMQVVLLKLKGNQLSGTVPYMPNLQVLDMSSNLLTEPRFDAVPATLQFLYLSDNKLVGELPNFRSLTTGYVDLKLLDLSHNNLSGLLPEDLLPSLSMLNISHNAFVGTLPSNWSKLQLADLRLDDNQLIGRLPPAWSAWGGSTDNSVQLSVTNMSLHGNMPKQWVEQFCLAIVEYSDARVLLRPSNIRPPTGSLLSSFAETLTFGPLIQLPAQHASINVTLASKTYSFDYNNPDSVCGIAGAARNTALVWGLFFALLVVTLLGINLWLICKPGPQGGLFSTILMHDKLHIARRVVNRIWYFVSDVFWTYYSQVTDAVTIHQVFSSSRPDFAWPLLAILVLPFIIMYILFATFSIKKCQEKVGGGTLMRRAAVFFLGLLLSPILFVGLQFLLIVHGIGVPLPSWWGALGIDLVTFYRMQSVAEAFSNALPQSIIQTRLYLMGNNPNGTHVYIDTNLFLVSIIGSLFSILKTVAFMTVELHEYGYTLLGYSSKLRLFFGTWKGYCLKLLKFESFP